MPCYAQSIHQLYTQAISAGYSEAELLKLKAGYALQCDIFAGMMTGSGKPHLAHGLGTASILLWLGAPQHVVLAGMVHNAYGMGDFGDGLKGPTGERRREVNRILGTQAEACVLRFHEVKPWTAEQAARILEQFEALDETGRNTLLIRLADDLEHHLDCGLHYRESKWMLDQAAKRRPCTLLLARQLQLPQLVAEFERVFAEYDNLQVPTVLFDGPQSPMHLVPRSQR
jgi:(p)ppGpp synthase/HD superfamily hydrolase